jgi:hypothetical protein
LERAKASAEAATVLSVAQRQELADFLAEAEALLREPGSPVPHKDLRN